MTDDSCSYRCCSAVVALLVVLGWGLLPTSAACAVSGPMTAAHCGGAGGTETARHCDGEMGASALCVTHHASQEATAEKPPSVDLSTTSSGETSFRPSGLRLPSPATLRSGAGPAQPWSCRRHAGVEVWLE